MAETPYDRRLNRAGWPAVASLARANALRWTVAVALVLLVGAALRFHGLGWDQPEGADAPLQMHPDERFLSLVSGGIDWPESAGAYFDTAKSPLNPYNDPQTHSYVYGTFPLFLAKGVSTIAGDDSYERTVIWGRRITALFDLATVAVVFGLGTVILGRRAGLVGALLYALAVLPTQLAHFWTMDPYVTFFGAASLLCGALALRAGRQRAQVAWSLALGLSIGLGLASKVTAWPLALAPFVLTLARIGLRDLPRLGLRWRGQAASIGGHWMTDVSLLCLSLGAALVVFRIAQPYAFAGPHLWDLGLSERWMSDIQREIDFQNGNVDFPPFVQFAGRTPVLGPVENMVLWGMGPALGVTAWVACITAVVVMFRRREVAFALPLAFAGAVLAFQGPRFVAFMRYFEPMYPVLCVFAGWGLVQVWSFARGEGRLPSPVRWPAARIRRAERPLRWCSAGAAVLVIAATAWWALAFQSLYSEEHPRIAASRWIDSNVAPGSSITGEVWDDTLPYEIPGAPGGYRLIETEPYTTDSEEKVRELVYGREGAGANRGLNGADYVAISSNRVRDSVRRLPAEYPATIRYYELLDSGGLGFERVATFMAHPTFMGMSIDDSGAEESFTVYDHPEVRLYRKTAQWDPEKAVALLEEAHPERAVNLLPRQGRSNGLEMTVEEARTQQAGGTFSEVFSEDGWTSHLPWLWWLAWLEVAGLATVPWLTWLCKALPDRGYGLSKAIGMGIVGLLTWLIVAWGGSQFGGGLAWAVFGAVAGIGLGLGLGRRDALRDEWRTHWRSWVAVEAVFLVSFFAFLGLRAFNPDLWYHPQGGEKPMEIAYLTAVTRAVEMPPYDPWFAGGTMNYYYMGWFLMAAPIRALRMVPEVAFNLGVPTFAALAATTAFSTVHNLVGLALNGERRRELTEKLPWRPLILAGLFGAVLLVGIGNLDGGQQTIERLQRLDTWHVAGDFPVLGGAFGVLGGLYRWLFEGAEMAPFDWWRSSRVHFGQFDITEFPYWSLLFGDLHPHLMDLPFFGLTIALVVAYVASAGAGLRAQAWALAGALGLALGLVRTIHTWDFPTAVLIVGGGVVLGQVLAAGRWQQRWWDGVGHLALAAGVLVVAFSPYTQHFEAFDSGLVRAPETTQAQQYFAHFGLFVAIALAFLAVRYHEELAARAGRSGRNPVLALVNGRLELVALAIFVTGVTAFTWRFGLVVVTLSALAEIFVMNLIWLELRARERNVPRLLVTAMFGLALAIGAGVDVVTVTNDIQRMNTVFKFLLQAWQLFALASAFAAWYAGRALWAVRGWRPAPIEGRRLAAWSAAVTIGVLLFGAAIFVWSGTRERQEQRFVALPPTLNGLAYLADARFVEDIGTNDPADDRVLNLGDDGPLIRWLRANVEGSPVIVEAVGPLYHWTGRISENTGLPAVIGWDWHQIQQRQDYADLVQARRFDTQRFYRDPGAGFAEYYLQKYNVSYVVVGTEEHAYGSPAALKTLSELPGLTEVFRSGENVIYRVEGSLKEAGS